MPAHDHFPGGNRIGGREIKFELAKKDDPHAGSLEQDIAGRDRRQPPILQPYPPRHEIPFAGDETCSEATCRNRGNFVDAGPLFPVNPQALYLTRLIFYAKSRNTIFVYHETNISDRERRGIDLDARTHGR